VKASDNCSGSLVITQEPVAGSLAPIGNTSIQITVTDQSGNSSKCTTHFVVEDQTSPVVANCGGEMKAEANSNCQFVLPDLTTQIQATDNCSKTIKVVQEPKKGTLLPVGSTDVVFTVTDGAGNSTLCSLRVVVEDRARPEIRECVRNYTAPVGPDCTYKLPDLTAQVSATDNCSTSLLVTQSPAAGTALSIGNHTVTFRVADAAGNIAECKSEVTVVDETKPVISACAPARTIYADNNGKAILPDMTGDVKANDNCGNKITIVQSPKAGTVSNVGTVDITLTVTDEYGNVSACNTTIEVKPTDTPDLDSDGDGVPDQKELTDGTDPKNGCDFCWQAFRLNLRRHGKKATVMPMA
jgi:hypothetical protein